MLNKDFFSIVECFAALGEVTALLIAFSTPMRLLLYSLERQSRLMLDSYSLSVKDTSEYRNEFLVLDWKSTTHTSSE